MKALSWSRGLLSRSDHALLAAMVVSLAVVPGSSRAQGPTPAGPQFQVNTYGTGHQASASVGSDGADGFVVVWSSEGSVGEGGSYTRIQGQRYDSTGSPAGGEFQINTNTTSYQYSPSVAPTDAGFVVVWHGDGSGDDTSGYSIQGQRYNSDGSPDGGEFQVNTYTTSDQYGAAVGSDGVDGFVVLWSSFGSSGSDTSGQSVQAQRFAPDGSPMGGQFQVNTYTDMNQTEAAVGSDGADGFVVVWESDGSDGGDTSDTSIQGQRFASDGSPVDGQFQVNTSTTQFQSGPSVGPDGAGGFVVIWDSFVSGGNDDSSFSIQGQRYASDGSPVGDEFQVNTYTTQGQNNAMLAPDGVGGFFVTWRSSGSNGPDTDGSIQGQRYASDGAPLGGEFQINTYTTSDQGGVAVGADAEGGLVVVWHSEGSAGGDTDGRSVQAQRYILRIFEDGFESGDTSAWSNTIP